MRTIKSMLFAVVVVAAQAFAADDAVTKEATGEVSLKAFGGNKEKASEEAKKLALRSAVEQAAGVFVQGDTLTMNSQLVMDRVYANTSGYVKKFDVVSQSVDKDVLKVVVKAEIGTAKLDADMQAVQGIIKRLGKTKLIVVLQEQAVDDKGVSVKSEQLSTLLTDTFKRDGWRIIDEKGTGARTGGMKIASSTAMGVPEAKELASRADADYILYGSVAFKYQPPSSMGSLLPEKNEKGEQVLFFVTGEYDLSLFEVQTGRQLAKVANKFDQSVITRFKISPTKSYAQTAFDICKADAPRIVSELRNPVLEYLRNQDVNGADVRVHVGGLKDFGEVAELEKALEQLSNVRGVSANGDFANGTQEFEIKYVGKAAELGRAINTSTFKKKKLNVTAVKNNEIEVAIAK